MRLLFDKDKCRFGEGAEMDISFIKDDVNSKVLLVLKCHTDGLID